MGTIKTAVGAQQREGVLSRLGCRVPEARIMKTVFLLMAQYDARVIIPLEWVQRDYFPHLDLKTLAARCSVGKIKLPLVRTDPGSQKSLKGVSLQDLAQ